MAEPNFFLVGAPKCGTTALYSYLVQHPEVFMPPGGGRGKEPHFHCPDVHSPRYMHDVEAYAQLFDAPEAEAATRVGEASVYYLYSEDAPHRILERYEDPRIIIMLRNPVDMVYSLHSQRLYNGYEDLADFEEALDAESDRREGRRIPVHGHPYQALQYRWMGRYAPHVQRWITVFGRQRVHVIVFDRFKTETEVVYREVLEFLEVDPNHQPELRVVNPNKRSRSPWVHRLFKFSKARRLAQVAMPERLRHGIGARVVKWNTVYERRPPMSSSIRDRLIEDLAEATDTLRDVLGSPLPSWPSIRG